MSSLRKRIDRLVNVEQCKKDADIRHALQYILDPEFANFYRASSVRALLRFFVEEGLSPASGVSQDERRALLSCLASSDRGEKAAARSLPLPADHSARLMIGAWLTNALRSDLDGFPGLTEVTPMSYYCDDGTSRVITATFRALGLPEEVSRMCALKPGAERSGARRWGEVLPLLIVGPSFALCDSPLSFADALLLVRAAESFPTEPRLGVFYLPAIKTMIIRTAMLRQWADPLLRLPIGTPFPPKDVERLISPVGLTMTVTQ